jgi:hypothetical protein
LGWRKQATGAPQKTKEEVAAELAERKKYLATVPLPTSDESDEMLRIRHTVRGSPLGDVVAAA